jgi:general secretion pathway protein F
MPTFRYRAYGTDGGLTEGVVDAASLDEASETLWTQGLTPFRLIAKEDSGTKWWNRELFSDAGSRRADLLAFTREFAMLNAAEIPLDDALRILREQASSPRLRSLVDSLLKEVLNGAHLSDALQKHQKVFPAEYVAVVRAGEIGGTLGDIFVELAELLERRAEVQARIQSALIYPCMLVVLSLGTLAIIIGGLIPSIAPIFEQSRKPMPVTIQIMLALRDNWWAIVVCGLVIGVLAWTTFKFLIRTPEAQRVFDRRKLRMPVLGVFLLQQDTARFARTLGTMLKAGVPMVQAAKSSQSVLVNRHIAAGIGQAIEEVQQGMALHRALRQETKLPPIALQMISVGEEAGKLDRMLARVALMQERQIQTSIDRFMSALTPALTVGVALMVGALIVPVMNAVLSINDLAAR